MLQTNLVSPPVTIAVQTTQFIRQPPDLLPAQVVTPDLGISIVRVRG